MSQKSTFSPKKAGLIAVAGVLLLSLLTLLVSQFFFNSEPTYAELIENKEYIDAYETYPNRYSDLLTAVYEEKDIETLEYLAEEKSDNQASNLYLALASDDTERIIDSYETIENKRILNDELLMSVADHYLLEQDIEGAKQVNQHISNNDYSEKIADTQNYIEIKKDLERVIDESDDESEVNQARRDLEQINTLLKVEEDE